MRSGDRQTERETEWNGVAENEAKKVKIVVRIQASAVLSRSRDRGKRFVISEQRMNARSVGGVGAAALGGLSNMTSALRKRGRGLWG